MSDMGLFYTTVGIENLRTPGGKTELRNMLVDTGSEVTWVPRPVLGSLGIHAVRCQGFIIADGTRLDRDIGYALIHAGGVEAPDLVVFAEASDFTLLGAHSLEGLNLRVDPLRRELVPAGPI